jgi:hypothetical protein
MVMMMIMMIVIVVTTVIINDSNHNSYDDDDSSDDNDHYHNMISQVENIYLSTILSYMLMKGFVLINIISTILSSLLHGDKY